MYILLLLLLLLLFPRWNIARWNVNIKFVLFSDSCLRSLTLLTQLFNLM